MLSETERIEVDICFAEKSSFVVNHADKTC